MQATAHPKCNWNAATTICCWWLPWMDTANCCPNRDANGTTDAMKNRHIQKSILLIRCAAQLRLKWFCVNRRMHYRRMNAWQKKERERIETTSPTSSTHLTGLVGNLYTLAVVPIPNPKRTPFASKSITHNTATRFFIVVILCAREIGSSTVAVPLPLVIVVRAVVADSEEGGNCVFVLRHFTAFFNDRRDLF